MILNAFLTFLLEQDQVCFGDELEFEVEKDLKGGLLDELGVSETVKPRMVQYLGGQVIYFFSG